MIERTVSGWWYVLAGMAVGLALGMLISNREESDEPGLASRLLKKIPTRVKVGGAVGAVKGGTKAALRR